MKKTKIPTSTPQDPAKDAKKVQQDPGNPMASLDANLRDDPFDGTFEKMAINFDPIGPKGKKLKNTYFV